MNRPLTEQEALAARRAQLTAELNQLAALAQGMEATRAREVQLAQDLAAVDAGLAAHQPARRALPMLDQVRIASPCHMTWQDMVGDERVRYCSGCEKNVFNLSAMLAHEAEALLEERLGKDLCVRFYQRADGTVMTSDCAVGVKKKRRKNLALAVAGAGAMAAAALMTLKEKTLPGEPLVTTNELVPDTRPRVVPPVMLGEPPMTTPHVAVDPPTDRGPRTGGPLMGAPPPHMPLGVMAPIQRTTQPVKPPSRPLMGKPALPSPPNKAGKGGLF